MTFDEMLKLEKGWDSYRADPPSLKAVENAKAFLARSELAGLVPIRVCPSVVGAVGIAFHSEDDSKEAYVEFYNKGTCCLGQFDDRAKTIHTQMVEVSEAGFDLAIAGFKQFLLQEDV